MSTSINHDNSITVVAYSLAEFAFELTELGAKGYCITYENDKVPFGGMGSIYQCTVVPRHSYRIDAQGNHLNVPNETNPETSKETPVNELTSTVESAKVTNTEQPIKQATTRAKKTT